MTTHQSPLTAYKVSFEFFPPKNDEQREQLDRTVGKFKAYKPKFVSVTFGAGGSTLSYTPDTIRRLREHHQLDAAPHLSCVGGTRAEINELLHHYKAMGCQRIVALRGDLPSGMGKPGDLQFGSDLVRFIREQHGDAFHIEVGCYPETHPQAEDAASDLKFFIEKMRAGANSAITQYFYNADAYFRFVDDVRKHDIHSPIIPGIMPISNFTQLKRFSDACGAEIPRWMNKRMAALGDDVEGVREFGADLVGKMCQRLLAEGVQELHFYTLNLAKPTQSVLSRLT
jgi:methylenetetrahydrofolate reductase (NADPH)